MTGCELPPDVPSSVVRTSAVTVISSPHGLQRRLERKIGLRDLQAAVKYGTRTPGFPCPRTGAARWKYTHADVVYVTDETGRHEITSWPVPAAGLDLPKVQVTPAMQRQHDAACKQIQMHLWSWTSHTVAVVDQSGSMRNTDLEDGATRSDAVWVALAVDFVAKRLETGEAGDTDVFSLVQMNDRGSVRFRHRPVDWLLYNDLIDLLRSAMPMSTGNYLPALDAADKLLLSNTHGSCALMLLFLSDGKPSDKIPPRHMLGVNTSFMSVRSKHKHLVQQRISTLASKFGRRLTVATIGFGSTSEDFSVLTSMSETCEEFGSVGVFQAPSLTIDALGSAMSSLTLTLTETKTELTQLGGSTTQRTVRDMRRESRTAVDDSMLSGEWIHYHPDAFLRVVTRSRDRSGEVWVDHEIIRKISGGVAVKRKVFGEGAERMVRKLRWVGERGQFVGPKFVAKESRFVEDMTGADDSNIKFHQVFCETQAKAQRLAVKFNDKLSHIPGKQPLNGVCMAHVRPNMSTVRNMVDYLLELLSVRDKSV